MRRRKQLIIAGTILALVATPAIGAPKKKPAAKKSAPAPQIIAPSAYVSSFMTYDVGTLRMTGKSSADFTYTVGTLSLTGRSEAGSVYSIGTLSMTGQHEP